MDVDKLKVKIIEKGLDDTKVAELIEINRTTLYRKLNGVDKLTIGEAVKLKTILDISNPEAIVIFLS